MARDEEYDKGHGRPVDFPEPVGLGWGSTIFEDAQAWARTKQRRDLREILDRVNAPAPAAPKSDPPGSR